MAVITLSVPDDLKKRMNGVDWVNWSSVAREAFDVKLRDLEELARIKRVQEISEIPYGDNREVRADVAAEVVKSTARTSTLITGGKIKPMTAKEFNKWCEDL